MKTDEVQAAGPAVCLQATVQRRRDRSTTTVSGSVPPSTHYDFMVPGLELAVSQQEQAVPPALATHPWRIDLKRCQVN